MKMTPIYNIQDIREQIRDPARQGYLFSLLLLALVSLPIVRMETPAMLLLVAVVIVLGCATYILHASTFDSGLNGQLSEEPFSAKYPSVDRVPVLRALARWGYQEGWNYSLPLLAILAVGFTLRVMNLGAPSFWSDEIYIVNSAVNFLNGNGFTLESGERYLTSVVSTLLVAASFSMFGISEFSARLPFVMIGSLTIPVVYVLVRQTLGTKEVALLSSAFVASSLWLIEYSREVRFYALNVLLLYLLILLLYNFCRSFQYKFLLGAVIVTALGVVNANHFLLFLPVYVYPVILYYRKVATLRGMAGRLLVALIALCILGIAFLFRETIYWALFGIPTIEFWDGTSRFYYDLYANRFLFISVIFIIILVTSLWWIKANPTNHSHHRFTYFFVIFPFSLFLVLSFLIDAKVPRYSLSFYALYFIPVLFGLHFLLNRISGSRLSFMLLLLAVFLVLAPVRDGYMVSQNKISYDPVLQKNKHSWREAVLFLQDLPRSGTERILTNQGLLLHHYGLAADATHPSDKTTKADHTKDFYSGLPFESSTEDYRGYIVLDHNYLNQSIYPALIDHKDTRLVYGREGIYIFYKTPREGLIIGGDNTRRIGTDLILDLNETFSMEFWIKRTDAWSSPAAFSDKFSSYRDGKIMLEQRNNQQLRFRYGPDGPGHVVSVTLDLDRWHMIHWIHEGWNGQYHRYSVYRDGQLVATERWYGEKTDRTPLDFGRATQAYYPYELADVHVHERGLTAGEVSNSYNNGRGRELPQENASLLLAERTLERYDERD